MNVGVKITCTSTFNLTSDVFSIVVSLLNLIKNFVKVGNIELGVSHFHLFEFLNKVQSRIRQNLVNFEHEFFHGLSILNKQVFNFGLSSIKFVWFSYDWCSSIIPIFAVSSSVPFSLPPATFTSFMNHIM